MSRLEKETREKISCIQKLVDQVLHTLKKSDKTKNPESLNSIQSDFEQIKNGLKKLDRLFTGKRRPVVGVFGCPSRGKSTLLNVLLGVDMLPMKGKAGTTRFSIELVHKPDSDDFSVTIDKKTTKTDYKPDLDEAGVREKLKKLSGESANLENPEIKKITVEGPFRPLIDGNIIFIDTPGVALGAMSNNDPDGTSLDHDFKTDAKRALAVLTEADVVIFCMINKYKEKIDAPFYDQKIIR
jgi:predicted GTPase